MTLKRGIIIGVLLLTGFIGGCYVSGSSRYTEAEAKKKFRDEEIENLKKERDDAKKASEDAKNAKDDAENKQKIADGIKAERELLQTQRDNVFQLHHQVLVEKARDEGNTKVAQKTKELEVSMADHRARLDESDKLKKAQGALEKEEKEFLEKREEGVEKERKQILKAVLPQASRQASQTQQQRTLQSGNGFMGLNSSESIPYNAGNLFRIPNTQNRYSRRPF